MTGRVPAGVRVGGQALPDGVLMRSERAWAIARADGSVEVGEVAASRFGRVPVLRVVFALVGALRLGVGRGMGRRIDRRLLAVFAGLEAAAFLAGRWLPSSTPGGLAGAAMLLGPWVATLAVLRVAAPGRLWRYHGAEHKAVSAYEAGVDLSDTGAVLRAARVHDRCGTNLVFVMLVLTVAVHGSASGWAQVPVFLALLGLSAEVVTLAARRPRWALSQVVLAGGKALQRWVTTAEPTASEQAVGCAALRACLAEHARLAAGTGAGTAVLVAAAA